MNNEMTLQQPMCDQMANFHQYDLFVDNAEVVLLNSWRNAIVGGEFQSANGFLDRLAYLHPEDRYLPDARKLMEACFQLDVPVQHAKSEQAFLEIYLMPIALGLLGQLEYKKFMVPFWRRLAIAFRNPFIPDDPQVHASWVFAQMEDWIGVLASIERESNWNLHPILWERKISALYQLTECFSLDWLLCLFQYCWRFPQFAEIAISNGILRDERLVENWDAFSDISEPMSVDWFPAFFLWRNPGILARVYLVPDVNTNASLAWMAVIDWIKSPKNIELKKALQQASGPLLRYFFPTNKRTGKENFRGR